MSTLFIYFIYLFFIILHQTNLSKQKTNLLGTKKELTLWERYINVRITFYKQKTNVMETLY